MRMAARRGDVEEIAHDHFFLRPVVEDMARDRHRRCGRLADGQVHGRRIPRPARQRPQGGDPDSRVLRPARVHDPPPGPAPHQSGARRVLRAQGGAGRRKRRSPAPGGATGLQIRVGPSDGPRWVRLPSSSAKCPRKARAPSENSKNLNREYSIDLYVIFPPDQLTNANLSTLDRAPGRARQKWNECGDRLLQLRL